MRDILFRGKAINRHKGGEYRTKYKNGDWVYGLLERHYNERFKFPAEMRNTDGVSGIQVDYKTIGQFTDLTDKNGKKIFEGDIIIYNDNENADGEGEFSIVVWYDDDVVGFALEHHSPSCEVYYECEWAQSCCYYEVIGNVHDNPELLKDGDKAE